MWRVLFQVLIRHEYYIWWTNWENWSWESKWTKHCYHFFLLSYEVKKIFYANKCKQACKCVYEAYLPSFLNKFYECFQLYPKTAARFYVKMLRNFSTSYFILPLTIQNWDSFCSVKDSEIDLWMPLAIKEYKKDSQIGSPRCQEENWKIHVYISNPGTITITLILQTKVSL